MDAELARKIQEALDEYEADSAESYIFKKIIQADFFGHNKEFFFIDEIKEIKQPEGKYIIDIIIQKGFKVEYKKDCFNEGVDVLEISW